MREEAPDPDSVWAKLLDPAPPPRDRERYGPVELARILFERLDANGDGGLDAGEFSRLPGEPRGIVWGGALGRDLFARFDKSRDGRVTLFEFALPPGLLKDLDRDRDGALERAEFPARRNRPYAFYPFGDPAEFRKLFDRDRDGKIVKREFPSREIFDSLDGNGDGTIQEMELTQAFAAARGLGVDAVPDDFVSRFDLDRDGSVSPSEFPGPESARPHLLREKPGARAGG